MRIALLFNLVGLAIVTLLLACERPKPSRVEIVDDGAALVYAAAPTGSVCVASGGRGLCMKRDIIIECGYTRLTANCVAIGRLVPERRLRRNGVDLEAEARE